MRGKISYDRKGEPVCSVHTNFDAVVPSFGAWSGKSAYQCRHCGAFEYVEEIR